MNSFITALWTRGFLSSCWWKAPSVDERLLDSVHASQCPLFPMPCSVAMGMGFVWLVVLGGHTTDISSALTVCSRSAFGVGSDGCSVAGLETGYIGNRIMWEFQLKTNQTNSCKLLNTPSPKGIHPFVCPLTCLKHFTGEDLTENHFYPKKMFQICW